MGASLARNARKDCGCTTSELSLIGKMKSPGGDVSVRDATRISQFLTIKFLSLAMDENRGKEQAFNVLGG